MPINRVSHLALIGSPPESRSHEGVVAGYYLYGARIEAFCTVDSGTQRPTQIGQSWLMKGCHVGHDAYIGDGCELAPHVCVGGWAEIEDDVRIGMGAIIRNRVKIGKGARIGMGAVVVKDVPAGEVWVGNPAHQLGGPDPLWQEWFDKSRGR